ncbi:Tautomerase protein [Stemphylium lycopersici]|nr:Tautomerase protein [Stemphylium lycopersici]
MPLWTIYHSDSIFKDEASKKALAKAITDLHVNEIGLPAFYVVVAFVPFPPGSLFVGGEHKGTPFVRISIYQIARTMELDFYAPWTSMVDKMLEPHIAAKGYDWEYHIDESPLKLWKVNGVYAPEFGSPEMELWKKYNRVIFPEEFDHAAARAKTKL